MDILMFFIPVLIVLILYILKSSNKKKGVATKNYNHPSGNLKKYRDIANQKNKQIIHFIHIGKTGGTAIKHAMGINRKSYEDEQHIIIGHRHSITLKDVNIGEKFFFIVRDPIDRFISAFYSRKRKGMPRIYNEWTKKEKRAFTNFSTPNELAKAIYSQNTLEKDNALDAMNSIDHIKTSYWDWFFDKNYFLSRKDDVMFIGNQKNLNEDFNKLKNILELPSSIHLPNDPIKMHKNPDEVDKNLDRIATDNLKEWYKKDYDFLKLVSSL